MVLSKSHPKPETPIYLTLKEACELSGRTKQWIDTRVERGVIHRYTQPGSQHPMYLKSQIERAATFSRKEDAALVSEIDSNVYYTIPEVAALLGVTRAWVWRQVHAGAIPARNLSGGQGHAAIWRIRKEDAEQYESTDLPTYYTIRQVATSLDVARTYIWQQIHDGVIPAINLSGKPGIHAMWRIKKEDADAFIASRQTNKKEN